MWIGCPLSNCKGQLKFAVSASDSASFKGSYKGDVSSGLKPVNGYAPVHIERTYHTDTC